MAQKEIITIQDIRAAEHCISGTKYWFARYSLDFRAFMKEGIDAEVLLATGDPLAVDVINRKRARG